MYTIREKDLLSMGKDCVRKCIKRTDQFSVDFIVKDVRLNPKREDE